MSISKISNYKVHPQQVLTDATNPLQGVIVKPYIPLPTSPSLQNRVRERVPKRPRDDDEMLSSPKRAKTDAQSLAITAILIDLAPPMAAPDSEIHELEEGRYETVFFEDERIYVGQLENGEFHGQGTVIYPISNEKAAYQGGLIHGKYEGMGRILFTNGNSYEGQLVNGQFHGWGVFYFANGNRYEGQCSNSQFHGQGTFYFASGNRYVGQFENSRFQGKGKFTFADGRTPLDGEFSNGKLKKARSAEPIGVVQQSTAVKYGVSYVGPLKNGQFHGQGTLTYSDGRKYVGEFANGFFHGWGTFIFANGNRYEGPFSNGQSYGQGSHILVTGDRYVGEFKNGKCHGRCQWIRADGGPTLEGIFKNGILISNQ